MNSASKILTVSYGTFSCTLEGFDDPFNTMRAIAEYFRDLAAEDRYFGAEPPTPDAAMLHKIAEREINRRVEANIQENGVILRAGDIKITKTSQSGTTPTVAHSVVASAEPLLGAAVSFDDDSVATRLIRLREAQAAATRSAVAVPATQDEDEADSDDAPEPPMLQADVWDSSAAAETLASVMADLDLPLPEPEVLSKIEAADAPMQIVAPEVEAATSAEPGVEELATWLPADDAAFSGFEEPDADPSDPSLDDGVQVDVPADGETDPSAATVPAPSAPQPTVPASDDAILRATLGAMIDPDGDDEFDATPFAATTVEVIRVEVEQIEVGQIEVGQIEVGQIEVGQSEFVDIETSLPTEAIAETPAADLIEPLGVSREDKPAASEAETSVQTDTRMTERLQRARARVIKIRRIDVIADQATPAAEVVTKPDGIVVQTDKARTTGSSGSVIEPIIVVAEPRVPLSALSAEAEAELQRELADLEADLLPAVEPAQVLEQQQRTKTQVEPQKPADPSPADDSVNRLISQTNAAMEGPENKRRLAAIAHLKAAVAATFADRKTNATPALPGPAERMDPYREDLDRVVRPRRPSLVPSDSQNASPVSVRPQIESRTAPLVLVSEQRIDRPAAAGAKSLITPVRPRRVTSDVLMADSHDMEADSDDQSGDLKADDVNNIFADPTQPFAEFAERLGAVTMPELMEAAAAYCALQLGRDQFTRPLLLQQIADLPSGDDFNREDCLRGFGTLLRDGRIQKIKRGQFKLSGQSRYLAEAKRHTG
jgi:hypothetical protein